MDRQYRGVHEAGLKSKNTAICISTIILGSRMSFHFVKCLMNAYYNMVILQILTFLLPLKRTLEKNDTWEKEDREVIEKCDLRSRSAGRSYKGRKNLKKKSNCIWNTIEKFWLNHKMITRKEFSWHELKKNTRKDLEFKKENNDRNFVMDLEYAIIASCVTLWTEVVKNIRVCESDWKWKRSNE